MVATYASVAKKCCRASDMAILANCGSRISTACIDADRKVHAVGTKD